MVFQFEARHSLDIVNAHESLNPLAKSFTNVVKQ